MTSEQVKQKWKKGRKNYMRQRLQRSEKNIFIAKAEIERLRANRKMSKKGKKNGEKLLQELKNLSIAELIRYKDREKSRLRKLKKGFWRSKKQEEARQLSRRFHLDPKSIYSDFGKLLGNKADSDRPVYIKEVLDKEQGSNKFKNIEEASSFWRVLWEGKNERNDQVNTKADWVKEVQEVMKE